MDITRSHVRKGTVSDGVEHSTQRGLAIDCIGPLGLFDRGQRTADIDHQGTLAMISARRAAAIAELRALVSWANDVPLHSDGEAGLLGIIMDHSVKALSLIDPQADAFLDAEAARNRDAMAQPALVNLAG